MGSTLRGETGARIDIVAETFAAASGGRQHLRGLARRLRGSLRAAGLEAAVSGDWDDRLPPTAGRVVVGLRLGQYPGAPSRPAVLHASTPRRPSRLLAERMGRALGAATGTVWPVVGQGGALAVTRDDTGTAPAPAATIYLGNVEHIAPELEAIVVAVVTQSLLEPLPLSTPRAAGDGEPPLPGAAEADSGPRTRAPDPADRRVAPEGTTGRIGGWTPDEGRVLSAITPPRPERTARTGCATPAAQAPAEAPADGPDAAPPSDDGEAATAHEDTGRPSPEATDPAPVGEVQDGAEADGPALEAWGPAAAPLWADGLDVAAQKPALASLDVAPPVATVLLDRGTIPEAPDGGAGAAGAAAEGVDPDDAARRQETRTADPTPDPDAAHAVGGDPTPDAPAEPEGDGGPTAAAPAVDGAPEPAASPSDSARDGETAAAVPPEETPATTVGAQAPEVATAPGASDVPAAARARARGRSRGAAEADAAQPDPTPAPGAEGEGAAPAPAGESGEADPPAKRAPSHRRSRSGTSGTSGTGTRSGGGQS